MIKEFTSITRKDILEDITATKPDPRQKARAEYNHPPDSVVSIAHCLEADKMFNRTGEFMGTFHKSKPFTSGAESDLFRGTRR